MLPNFRELESMLTSEHSVYTLIKLSRMCQPKESGYISCRYVSSLNTCLQKIRDLGREIRFRCYLNVINIARLHGGELTQRPPLL